MKNLLYKRFLYFKYHPIRQRQMAKDFICFFVIISTLSLYSGCRPSRWGSIVIDPVNPRQGDEISVTLNAGDKNNLERVEYQINDLVGEASTVPVTIEVDTCPTRRTYYPTKLIVSATRFYTDGERKTGRTEFDLTSCKVERQNPERKYAIYLAPEWDPRWATAMSLSADKFEQTFRSAALVERSSDWAAFADGFEELDPLNTINSVDLAILMGHGSPHIFVDTNAWSSQLATHVINMRLGGLASCARNNPVGELEYIAFISCSTLSIEDYNEEVIDPITGERKRPSVFEVWFGPNQERPFSGLHMALGFRTIVGFVSLFGHFSQVESLCENFARRMDDGFSVREAWFDSVGEAFSPIAGGLNMPAAIYLKEYRNSQISWVRDDYIYGSNQYESQVIEYWE